MARRVVVTGVAGAGKTTLLDALRERGWATGGDAARDLVRADVRVRDDDEAFRRAILAREVAAYDAATRTTFFDRAIPDVAAGWTDLPEDVDAIVRSHPYDAVYLLPPWREIYVTDAERTHTFDEAVRAHPGILEAYVRYGYDVVILPRASVEERVRIVETTEAGVS